MHICRRHHHNHVRILLTKGFYLAPFIMVHQHGCHTIVFWISEGFAANGPSGFFYNVRDEGKLHLAQMGFSPSQVWDNNWNVHTLLPGSWKHTNYWPFSISIVLKVVLKSNQNQLYYFFCCMILMHLPQDLFCPLHCLHHFWCSRVITLLLALRPSTENCSYIPEAFQGVQATSDMALKTGDMGLSKHQQATTEPAKYDSDTTSIIDRQRCKEIVYLKKLRLLTTLTGGMTLNLQQLNHFDLPIRMLKIAFPKYKISNFPGGECPRTPPRYSNLLPAFISWRTLPFKRTVSTLYRVSCFRLSRC